MLTHEHTKSYPYFLLGEDLFQKCLTIGASHYELQQRLQFCRNELDIDVPLDDFIQLCGIQSLDDSDIVPEINVATNYEYFRLFVYVFSQEQLTPSEKSEFAKSLNIAYPDSKIVIKTNRDYNDEDMISFSHDEDHVNNEQLLEDSNVTTIFTILTPPLEAVNTDFGSQSKADKSLTREEYRVKDNIPQKL